MTTVVTAKQIEIGPSALGLTAAEPDGDRALDSFTLRRHLIHNNNSV